MTNLYTPVTVATSLSLPLFLSLRGEKSTGGRATGRVPNSVFFFFFFSKRKVLAISSQFGKSSAISMK